MAIERHLVFDPDSGHLVFDPDSGHLVRAAICKIDNYDMQTKTGQDEHSAPWPGPYPAEADVMAHAFAAMQAASWDSGRSPERYTYKYTGDNYYTQCRARASCFIYDCDAAGVSGEDIVAITVKVKTPYGAPASYNALTYRLKIHISATGAPYTAWADIYNSPHFTGATNDWVTIPYVGTLNDYLIIYQTCDSYDALTLAGAGFNGEDARILEDTDPLILALDE